MCKEKKKKIALSLLKFSLTFASLTPLTCLFSTSCCIQHQQQQWARRKMSWKLRKISSLFFLSTAITASSCRLILSFVKKKMKIFFLSLFLRSYGKWKEHKVKITNFFKLYAFEWIAWRDFSLSLYELSIFSIRKWY